MVTPTFIL